MMTPLRDLPIRRKLLLITFTASAAALALASAGFLTWDVVQFRAAIRQDLVAQARIIAEGSWAPLQFDDTRPAEEMLALLDSTPRIAMACLYRASAVLFAAYYRDHQAACPPSPPSLSDAPFDWDSLDILVPVTTAGGQTVGLLYIHRDLADLYERLRIGAGIALGLLLLALATAFVIAARMQRSIAEPLLQLAETARTVSTSRDYSLRAIPASSDEIGVVVHAFNDMLDRIGERTEQLSTANAELEREVEERRRVEAERTAALERERDANRLKDEFLATLSHELRTPLNAVLGWTRVLRSTHVEPATGARALESIERNARLQARLIEDLLEISRIVTGKLRLQVREIDLVPIVESAVDVIQPAATAKRLQVSVDIAVRPAMTMGDPDRLQQVVWNLLSNAVKFTPPEGRVSVRLERADGYRLTVRDTGSGIDAKFLRFVFEPFRQADGSASREHGGLGLGLAIAKQLVELHGGTIQARSLGRGAGAAFEVVLPSMVAFDSPEVSSRPVVAALPEAIIDDALLRDLHVLVVDDEEDARALLKTALAQYGAEVTTAASAAEAVAAIDRRPPDVLLSDIGMPREDGYQLIRHLRARPAGSGGAIPAIAVTAYASLQDRIAAEAAGYQAHVAKPFEPAELADLVARLGRPAQSARRR